MYPVYPIIRISGFPIEVGLTIPNIESLDPGTHIEPSLQPPKAFVGRAKPDGGFKYVLFSPLFGEDFQFD